MNQVETAKRDGHEQGYGRGERDKAIAIARSLLAAGVPPAEVAEHTGLPLGEVLALVAES